ncbi:hypothetical protein F4560_001197 [Saccharothrix ecbatanensis]|uniref:PknH-like protein n=1 Tax=Saccharothrix ecbatanensis TaxID=1105145 RepID=A0A7W9HG93_9PSEU|nr:hypothetical protein [Saccharothrix ecbatanensis]MBB5801429.1 hypothetical protein [Saccharothrix ecbatanensis]
MTVGVVVRGVVTVACAVVLVAGCSAQADPPAAPTEDPAAVAMRAVEKLVLPDQVTSSAGLTPVGGPEVGVQPLVSCPDPAAVPELAAATPAIAGRTQRWQWTAPDGTTVPYSLYSAVYDGIPAREAIKQARAVTKCYPNQQDPVPWLDRQVYRTDGLPSTKPFVDDRFAYCVRRGAIDYTETVDEHLASRVEVVWDCAAFMAEGQKLVRLNSVQHNRKASPLNAPTVDTVGQAMVDALVAP